MLANSFQPSFTHLATSSQIGHDNWPRFVQFTFEHILAILSKYIIQLLNFWCKYVFLAIHQENTLGRERSNSPFGRPAVPRAMRYIGAVYVRIFVRHIS